ncbi:MAG: RagB/SusD family nutrient uptake outer membrane protein [Dysgonomonas sp.]
MKKLNILFKILVLSGTIIFNYSCSDFLDVELESKTSIDMILEDSKMTDSYMIGIYRDWRECHKPRSDYYLGTDEAKLGGVQYRDNQDRRGIEMYSNELGTTNGVALNLWNTRYQIVSAATIAIEGLRKKGDLSPSMERYLGEACALRASAYFELVQHFGEIPMNNAEVIAEHGSKRQSLELVYSKIAEDFTTAIQYLPDPSDTTFTDKTRFSKTYAQAMLGKAYLYAQEESGFRSYEKAKEQFKAVYENAFYNRTGASQYNVIFDETGASDGSADYEREMIYAFRFSNVRNDNSGAQWDVGSRAVAVMSAVEAVIYYAGFDALMPTRYCYADVDSGGIWETGDVRKNLSIRYDFKYNGKQPELIGYCYGDELDPHIKKYEDKRTENAGLNTWYSGKHIPYLRFSDIVLCYAECLYMTGSQAEGINLINNVVRKRAFGGRISSSNKWSTAMGQDEFYKNLMDERMRELCFEGWRKLDLIRTGKTKEYTTARNSWMLEKGVTDFPNTRLRLPIPLDELQMNPDMSLSDQNPGYN